MLIKFRCLLITIFSGLLLLATHASAERAEMLWEVPIESQHQQCQGDHDCGAVKTSCNDCECFGKPVNKQHIALYQKRKKELCETYRGPHCLMLCGDASFECVNGRCIIMSTPAPPLENKKRR